MLNGHNGHKLLLCILALQIWLQSLTNLAHKDFSILDDIISGLENSGQ
jgi:hypothetical protein